MKGVPKHLIGKVTLGVTCKVVRIATGQLIRHTKAKIGSIVNATLAIVNMGGATWGSFMTDAPKLLIGKAINGVMCKAVPIVALR